MLALLPLLLGCGRDIDIPTGPTADTGTRTEVLKVNFNLWVDYIPLYGAYDEQCRWLDPQLTDDSTPWPPLQAFWVIYEDPDDVEITQLNGTYFEGDRISPEDFGPLEGFEPLGFMFFTGFQTGLLSVQEIRRDDDDQGIEADFGSPIDATVRIEAEPDGDGCTTRTLYCTDDCPNFEPLESIDIDLGAFYVVQDIRFL